MNVQKNIFLVRLKIENVLTTVLITFICVWILNLFDFENKLIIKIKIKNGNLIGIIESKLLLERYTKERIKKVKRYLSIKF